MNHLPVEVVVDGGGDHRELSNQVHGVLEVGLPVLGLVDTLSVRLGRNHPYVHVNINFLTKNGREKGRRERERV